VSCPGYQNGAMALNYVSLAQMVKLLLANFLISFKTFNFEMDLFSVLKEPFPRPYSQYNYLFSSSCSA